MELLKGKYAPKEAEELINKMFQLNIEYHENKIGSYDSEEDIKMRERKIRALQASQALLKEQLKSSTYIELSTQLQIKKS